MAAPKSAPAPTVDTARAYASPDVAPRPWVPSRPGEIAGAQPAGERLGYQGPDQGFALKIANGFRDRLRLTKGEHADDAIRGCLAIALRRASMFSRAPVVHDLTIAFTAWGFLDASAPADLVAFSRRLGPLEIHSRYDNTHPEHREIFFRYAWVDYSTHKPGTFRLSPPAEHVPQWRADYREMLGPMFFGDTPTFEELMEAAAEFQRAFNATG